MLNLTENLPRKRKRFNPYKPLLVMADHPAVSAYIGGWALALVAFFVGLPLNSGFLVGGAMVAAMFLGIIGILWALFAMLDWIVSGGWYRVRRELQRKMENHGRIED